MNVDDLADELYSLPPDEFTAARNARAKELAASGDRQLADMVRKLAKPSVSAWLVNVLARQNALVVRDLVSLGPRIRQAQRSGSRDDMRTMTERRRELVRDLVGAAAEAAAAAGRALGPQVQRQVEETLEASVADDAAATALQAGRLTEPLRFVGFGGPPAMGSGMQKASSPKPPGKTKATTNTRVADGHEARGREPDDAGRALHRAAEELARARKTSGSTVASAQEARRNHQAAVARVRVATTELRGAERARVKTAQALHVALQAQDDAERRLKQAERAWKRQAGGADVPRPRP